MMLSYSRRGSRGSGLNELSNAAPVFGQGKVGDVRGRLKMRESSQPSWSTITRYYAPDYAVLLALTAALCVSEYMDPYQRIIKDAELWRYSFPLRKNTVPSWSVPVLALSAPALGVTLHALLTRQASRLEVHNAVLGSWSCVITAALITNLVKLGVGRPRPSFVERCWPDMDPEWDESTGLALCSDKAVDPAEGLKSFPSGHTSWSTAGLGYLSCWLAGKLRLFDGSGHVWKVPVALSPLGGAAWIGITRLQDYWHHWEDVMVGFLLGLVTAYAYYRIHYNGLTGPQAGEPVLPNLLGNGGEAQSARTRYQDLEAPAPFSEAQH